MAVLFTLPGVLLFILILGITSGIPDTRPAIICPLSADPKSADCIMHAPTRRPAVERERVYQVLKTYYSGAFTTTANMVAKYGCGAVKSSSAEYRRRCGPWRVNPLEQAPRRVMVRRDVPRVGLRGWRRKCCST